MAILVPRWLDFSWQVRLQMCLKVCMVKIANRTRAQTRSTITRYRTVSLGSPYKLNKLDKPHTLDLVLD